MRLTLGLPGRLEAWQRSNAGLLQANLNAEHDDGEGGLLQQPAKEGHGVAVLVVVQVVVDPH